MKQEGNSITIVTVCDNHFAVMLAVLLKSIEVNHHAMDTIDLYIVEDRMSAANKAKISNTITDERFNLHWLKMAEVLDQAILPLDASTFPLNVYVRLFIPQFLPDCCTRAIYLDVDMVVRTEIADLWKVDLNNCVAAAVLDRAATVSTAWAGIKNYQALGLAPETGYFNSGLLILDLVKWRSYNLTNEIITCIVKNKQFASFPDQYGLNVVLANKWKQLDSRWNSFATSYVEDAYIIHFIGRKPIYMSYDNNLEYKNEFFKYLALTNFRGFKPLKEYLRFSKKLINLVEKKMKSLLNSKQL